MFNAKRIIFIISLLSLVAITGALMVGPAFAKGDKGDKKVEFCHYQGYEAAVYEARLDEEGDPVLADGIPVMDLVKAEEHEAWMMKNTSVNSWVKHHSVNHTPDDINYDFLTDDEDRDGEGALITTNDTSVCTDRDAAIVRD